MRLGTTQTFVLPYCQLYPTTNQGNGRNKSHNAISKTITTTKNQQQNQQTSKTSSSWITLLQKTYHCQTLFIPPLLSLTDDSAPPNGHHVNFFITKDIPLPKFIHKP